MRAGRRLWQEMVPGHVAPARVEVFCSICVFDKGFILQKYKINLLFANILTKKIVVGWGNNGLNGKFFIRNSLAFQAEPISCLFLPRVSLALNPTVINVQPYGLPPWESHCPGVSLRSHRVTERTTPPGCRNKQRI